MSFHSTQATSQALQPMQVVTSMYLQTSSWRWTPAPGTLPECAEMALIWRVPVGMGCLNLFQLHEEALELGRIRVRIVDGRCEPIRDRPGVSALVFGDAAIPLMDRQADLIRALAIDHHRLDALGDHRLGDVVAPRAGDLHLVAAPDAQVGVELLRNL